MAATRRVIRLPYGARVVITTDTEAAQFTIALKQKTLRNTRPLLEALAAILRAEARDRFAEGGRNPRWQRLADSTIAEKAIAGLPARTKKGNIPRRLVQRGRFGPGNILMRTGALRDSWVVKSNPNHVETYDVKRGIVTIGSKLPYAAVHQTGGISAYTILAKNGKVLAFTVGSGKKVFAKSVKHPPLPARPVTISRDGVAKMKATAMQYLEKGVGNGPNVDM